MSIIIFPTIIIYFLINIKNWELEHVRKEIIVNFLAIITITSFFILPYLQTSLSTEYVGSNVSKQDFLDNRVSIKSLFVTSKNSKDIVEIGPHIIIILALSLISLHKQKENEKKEYIFYLSMALLYIILSLKLFPWGIFPNFVSRIEHSYNFLIVATFFECLICGININNIFYKFKIIDIFIIIIISLLFLIPLKNFIPHSEKIENIENCNISQIVDYRILPKKAKENLEYIKNRSKDVEVINGNAEIIDKNKLLTHYNFKANTLSDGTIYELPYIYYPGYEIRCDGIIMDYFESENGLIAIKIDKEDGINFEVNFIGTKLMNLSKIISLIGMIAFGIYVYKRY